MGREKRSDQIEIHEIPKNRGSSGFPKEISITGCSATEVAEQQAGDCFHGLFTLQVDPLSVTVLSHKQANVNVFSCYL